MDNDGGKEKTWLRAGEERRQREVQIAEERRQREEQMQLIMQLLEETAHREESGNRGREHISN